MENNNSENCVELLTSRLLNRISDFNTPANVPFVIRITEKSGRGVYANRDISVHEKIFCDRPLIVGPRFEKDQTICVVCFKKVIQNEICSKGCTLPVCKSCQNSSKHEQECEKIREWKPKNPEKMSPTILRGLCSIRAILLDDDDKHLLKMLQANASPNQLDEIQMLSEEFDRFDASAKKFLFQTSAILNTNTFKSSLMPETGPSNNSPVYVRGVYPVSAMLNHSCTPNTRCSFDDELVMCVRATQPIKEGDQIFTSYCKSLVGTPLRRILLKQTKQFLCGCIRCRDPTEFSTNLSALNCIDDSCGGILLPCEPLKINGDWLCTKCRFVHTPRKVFMMQQMISDLVATKIKCETVDNLIRFVEEKLAQNLPATNQVSLEIKLVLIWKIGSEHFKTGKPQLLQVYQSVDYF